MEVRTQTKTDACPASWATVTTENWQEMYDMVANVIITIVRMQGSPQSMNGNIVLACMLVTHMKSIGRILRQVLAALQANSRLHFTTEFSAGLVLPALQVR